MRVLLFTGKGGVGKTTMAAATALSCADAGLRTLVLSTDPAHSLADAFDVPLDADATEISRNLYGQQLDATERLEEAWGEVQEYLHLRYPNAKPVMGGSLVYGLEADTSGGWCLYKAQLAIGGIQVARAIYDTLTTPGGDGKIHPFLAESVTMIVTLASDTAVPLSRAYTCNSR